MTILGQAWSIVGVLCLAMLILWAMTDDYQIEVKEQQIYCQEVEAGTYPDYKGIYEDVCE